MSNPSPPPAPPPGSGNLPAVYGSSMIGDPGESDMPDVAGSPDALPPGVAFDSLVDAVVQRIERRVIEEMERRGRWPGGEMY